MRHRASSHVSITPAAGRFGAPGTRLHTLSCMAVAALAAVVPLIVAAGLWLRSQLDQSERELEALLTTRASALSERLDAEVHEQLVVLQSVAALPSLDEPDLPAFHATAGRMIAPVREWLFLGLVGLPEGRHVLNTLRPVGSDLPELGPVRTFRRVAETRRPAVETQDVRTDALSPVRTVLLCVPVFRDGAVRFVLTAGMKDEAIQGMVDQAARSDSRLMVTDASGTVLARSPSGGALDRTAAPERADGASDVPYGLLAGTAPDGRAVSTAFHRSPATGWTAFASAERATVAGVFARVTWATMALVCLSLLLAATLAVALFYNVTERRLGNERLVASQALSELDARLLAATQEALAEQRKAASERDVLLREIYHRVKNNLQIVQSLLRLGSRTLKPDQREPFESAIRRIGAMARVHTLLYNSPDLASIDFRDYLDVLLKEAAEAFGAEERGIRTVLDAESMRVPLDTAVPLAFVVVEILTNAFKHAFPSGQPGTVRITAAQEDGHGVLTIADNGVGLPSQTVRGTLGLTIIDKLIEQVSGSVVKPGAGESTFRVRFPLGKALDLRTGTGS